jgi:hypothetical protein
MLGILGERGIDKKTPVFLLGGYPISGLNIADKNLYSILGN